MDLDNSVKTLSMILVSTSAGYWAILHSNNQSSRKDNDERLNRALVSAPKNALLGPLTGMSVAMLAMQGNQSSTSLRAHKLVGVMVRARLRHAEIVGVHPLRLLTFFSMQEAGWANDPTLVFLSTDERLIDGDD